MYVGNCLPTYIVVRTTVHYYCLQRIFYDKYASAKIDSILGYTDHLVSILDGLPYLSP